MEVLPTLALGGLGEGLVPKAWPERKMMLSDLQVRYVTSQR